MQRRVCTRQGKTGATVIENCIQPRSRIVASLASLGKPNSRMAGIIGSLVILKVTGDARCARKIEVSVDVTLRTLQLCMRSRQREPGEGEMVESGTLPTVHTMTLFTCGREMQSDVIGSGGGLIVLAVTTVALGRQAQKLSGSSAFVTRITLQCSVGANERKPILVILDRLRRNLPCSYAVTLLAAGSELAAMDVGVAVCAPRARIAEDQLGVALRAEHPFVHTV